MFICVNLPAQWNRRCPYFIGVSQFLSREAANTFVCVYLRRSAVNIFSFFYRWHTPTDADGLLAMQMKRSCRSCIAFIWEWFLFLGHGLNGFAQIMFFLRRRRNKYYYFSVFICVHLPAQWNLRCPYFIGVSQFYFREAQIPLVCVHLCGSVANNLTLDNRSYIS